MHITYCTYRVHIVVDKRITLDPFSWIGESPNYWGTEEIWWNTETDGVALLKYGPYHYLANSGKLENKLDRLLLDSKEGLWLEWQKSWEIISVDVLRKIYWHWEMSFCSCSKSWTNQVFRLKVEKKSSSGLFDVCCTQSNNLQISTT